jgi:hypothetical protein
MEVRQNSPVLFRARLLRFPFLVLLPFFLLAFLGLGWGFLVARLLNGSLLPIVVVVVVVEKG